MSSSSEQGYIVKVRRFLKQMLDLERNVNSRSVLWW
jgi:hypothetical protein